MCSMEIVVLNFFFYTYLIYYLFIIVSINLKWCVNLILIKIVMSDLTQYSCVVLSIITVFYF